MTAPTYRGSQQTGDTLTGSTASPATLNFNSTGAVAGDTVAFGIMWQFNGTTMTTPAGWTSVSAPAGTSGNQLRVIAKQVTSGEVTTGSVAVTFSASAVIVAVAHAYAGTVTFGTPVTSNNLTTAPAVTVGTAGSDVLTYWGITHATLQPGTVAFASGTLTQNPASNRSANSNVRLSGDRLTTVATGSQGAGATTVTGNAAATTQGIAFEVIGPASTNYTASPADPEAITDTAATVQALVRAASDPEAITDATNLDRSTSAADPVGGVDSVGSVIDGVRGPSDGVGGTDSASTIIAAVRAPADAVGGTDSAAAVQDAVRAAADPEAITDAASAAVDAVRTVSDPEALSDAVTLDRAQVQPDPVGITDFATPVTDGVRTQADNVGLTDTATTTRGTSLSDPAGITDSTTQLLDAVRSIGDPVGLSDSVTAQFAGDTSATPADPEAITDSAAAVQVAQRAAGENVGITDSVTVSLVAAATVTDSVAVADQITAVMARVVTVADFLGILDDVTAPIPAIDRDITATATLVRSWSAGPLTSEWDAELEPRTRTAVLDHDWDALLAPRTWKARM